MTAYIVYVGIENNISSGKFLVKKGKENKYNVKTGK
jgi:hypothetical protein